MGSAILIKAHALINAQFQLAALKSDTSVRRLVAASGSTAQQAIYIRDIRSLPLPLPPLAEQTRIVAEVERRLSVVEELESVVTANLQRATRQLCSENRSHFQNTKQNNPRRRCVDAAARLCVSWCRVPAF